MHESQPPKFFVFLILSLFLTACDFAQAAGSHTPLTGDNLLRIILGLVLVLVAVGATAWLMRQFFRIQPGLHGQLRILSGVSMGPRERIVLLEVGDTQLLIGVAPGRIQTLHVLASPVDVSQSHDAPRSSFARHLARRLANARNVHA